MTKISQSKTIGIIQVRDEITCLKKASRIFFRVLQGMTFGPFFFSLYTVGIFKNLYIMLEIMLDLWHTQTIIESKVKEQHKGGSLKHR